MFVEDNNGKVSPKPLLHCNFFMNEMVTLFLEQLKLRPPTSKQKKKYL